MGDSDEEILNRVTLGEIRTSLTNMKKLHTLSTQEFGRIKTTIDEVQKRWNSSLKTEMELIKTELDLIKLHSAIVDTFISTEIRYNSIKQAHALSHDELTTIHGEVLTHISPYIIPPLSEDDMARIAKFDLEKGPTGELIWLVEVPVIHPHVYSKYKVYPMPMNDSIHVLSKDYIVVNKNQSRYIDIDENDLEVIGNGMLITKKAVTKQFKLSEASPCRFRLFHNERARCKSAKLTKHYDVWTPTPIPDAYAFYSNVDKNLTCDGTIYHLSAVGGLFRFTHKCELETENVVITPTVAAQGNIPSAIHVITDDWLSESDLLKNSSKFLTTLVNHADADIMELIDRTLKQPDRLFDLPLPDWPTWMYTGRFVSLIVVLILTFYLIKARLSRKKMLPVNLDEEPGVELLGKASPQFSRRSTIRKDKDVDEST